MPIHYDIESDVLYKEGIEKGATLMQQIVKMLLAQKPLKEISMTLNVDEAYVKQVAINVGLDVPE